MERLFVGVEIEINRISTTTNKKSEKANHEFLHFLLFSLTLQSYTIKTAFPPFYCIISPHPRKLGTNRAVGTSRSRYIGYRRHRCRRYGVREGLLRTPAASLYFCSCGSRCVLAPLLRIGWRGLGHRCSGD